MFHLILFLNFIQILHASFCGEGFMAYGLSLSFGGQFTLGCAQPTCLKFPIIESPTFVFVNGVKDGFVNLPLINEKAFINDRAVCETTFNSTDCTAEDQWLAGIAPISDLSNVTSLSLRCCKHWAIKSGKFQKVVTIKNGEMYSGGDIYDSEEEEVIAFDYITNIKKFDMDNGTLIEIVVNRLPCSNLEVDDKNGLSKNKVRIHQAPLVETGDYPAVDYDSVTVENDETSTLASESDVTAAESYSEGNKYNINLSPPEVASEAPPVPEYQTLSPNIEPQTLANNEQPPQPQSSSNIQQPQTQTQQNQQNVETQQSSYAQPGNSAQPGNTNQQQQSSYVNPLMPSQPLNPSYQAPYYPMHPMLSSFMNPSAQNQFYNNPQSGGQSYQSQSASNGYYPVAQQSAAGGGGCCGGMMCFTGDTLVTLMNGTKKRMDQLTVDDWVLTGGENQIGFSKIRSWLHRKPNLVTKFIKFTLENGVELKMTKKHYIFKSDCSEISSPVKVEKAIQNMVYAENVTINDCLFVINQHKKLMKTQISKIEIIKEKGIYSPMTTNGNIIVNDVFASCFNVVQNDVVQITFPTIIKTISGILSKLLYYILGFNFVDYNSYQLQNEIDLIPGLKELIEVVKVVVPRK